MRTIILGSLAMLAFATLAFAHDHDKDSLDAGATKQVSIAQLAPGQLVVAPQEGRANTRECPVPSAATGHGGLLA